MCCPLLEEPNTDLSATNVTHSPERGIEAGEPDGRPSRSPAVRVPAGAFVTAGNVPTDEPGEALHPTADPVGE